MTGNISQDWVVYALLGAVACFFVYIIIKGNLPQKDSKKQQE